MASHPPRCSYHFLLWRALPASTRTLGLDSHFGLPRLLWFSTSTSGINSSYGGVWTSRFKVFNCFGLRLWALTRASSFPARFGWCHQHWLGGAGTAGGRRHWLLAGARTGRGRTTSSSLLASSMNPVIPLYTDILQPQYC